MAQVNFDSDTVVHEELSDGNRSVTVPSGEVWKVRIVGGGWDPFNINNLKVFEDDQALNGWNTTETVFTGGDSLEYVSANADRTALVSGWEVSNTVDHNAISHTLDSGESITVPTGELWQVTLTFNGFDIVNLNGSDWKADGNANNAESINVLLNEGDTILYDSADVGSGRGCHIGGFDINS